MKKKQILTFAGFPIWSKCVAFSTFTHTGVFCVHKLLFTSMAAISTVINLWDGKNRNERENCYILPNFSFFHIILIRWLGCLKMD